MNPDSSHVPVCTKCDCQIADSSDVHHDENENVLCPKCRTDPPEDLFYVRFDLIVRDGAMRIQHGPFRWNSAHAEMTRLINSIALAHTVHIVDSSTIEVR